MDTSKTPATNPGVAAEPDRVAVPLVAGSAVGLAVVTAIAAGLMALLFWGLDRQAGKQDAKIIEASGLERRDTRLPPPPRLQVYPARHWTDFRDAEQQRLDSYGWLDRGTGSVHIPIDRAMELVTERGVGPLPPGPMTVPPAAGTAPAGVKK
jgi:hypothetical protein